MTFNQIQKDMYKAMKEQDKERKLVLSTLMANAKNEAITAGESRDNVPDAIVDQVIIKEKKLLQKMIEEFPANTNKKEHLDLLKSYHDRLAIVNEYAPQVIDDENEIKVIINESGIPLDKKNMGKIMGMLKGKKCDMAVANKVVKAVIEEAESN